MRSVNPDPFECCGLCKIYIMQSEMMLDRIGVVLSYCRAQIFGDCEVMKFTKFAGEVNSIEFRKQYLFVRYARIFELT